MSVRDTAFYDKKYASNESLGHQVKPAEVRLLPRGSDFYTWRVIPGNEEICSKIFSKSLSDHSVNALRLLREEVGKSFEATKASENPNLDAQKPSSLIAKLQDENAHLSDQLRMVAGELAAERDHRRDLEEENRNLRSTQSLLEKKLQDQVDIAENFRRVLARCVTVLPVLENMRKQIAESLGDVCPN
ncbi:uncharacterized protein PpBr36_10336 [Pyricularia pennisetigena]|uniref:uncharacterized protein n=1 Tax=Pyricularia pennisetigena TaxID=1578925 RepID=UPI00114F3850|nr:uncharacterized protein PpBr36_10336 [Pyricularia pennisetigena]TLS21466.1 hypothetical protein PpBr36_10336 [Pyricularia pennisetigena]